MIRRMYTVYDSVADHYSDPFYARSDDEAKRIVHDAAKDERSYFYQHPNDYFVYCVGAFDSDTGEVAALKAPSLIVAVSSFSRGE